MPDEKANTGLREAFTAFFREGIKKEPHRNLGVEMEHFIVDAETLAEVSYQGSPGIRDILQELYHHYPGAKLSEAEDIFGFTTEDFNITLEPAAQLEISIMPKEDIAQIGAIYGKFRQILEDVLTPYGYRVLTLGCQPKSRVRDLPLIPKKRYHLMDEHFAKTGTGGIEMMRGTASAQISIDFFSEEDFRKKLQAAYLLLPLLQLLNDNAKEFQGEQLNGFLKRTDIWRRTDAARSCIVPDIFKADYSFSDYADYLCGMPPILLQRGLEAIPTGFRTSEEIFADQPASREDIQHLLSMAFPDIRVKNYIEIRGADSVEPERMLAYCALVKGVLYSAPGLDCAAAFIRERKLSNADIAAAQDDLMKNGWDGEIYGMPVRRLANDVLTEAARQLSESEQAYLEPYREEISA